MIEKRKGKIQCYLRNMANEIYFKIANNKMLSLFYITLLGLNGYLKIINNINIYFVLGLRTINTNWNSSNASCSQRNRTRLHVRYKETTAYDYVRCGKSSDTNLSKFT